MKHKQGPNKNKLEEKYCPTTPPHLKNLKGEIPPRFESYFRPWKEVFVFIVFIVIVYYCNNTSIS